MGKQITQGTYHGKQTWLLAALFFGEPGCRGFDVAIKPVVTVGHTFNVRVIAQGVGNDIKENPATIIEGPDGKAAFAPGNFKRRGIKPHVPT